MVASTGRAFLDDGGVDAYRQRLLPHALVVTPNLWEAALLAGVPSRTSGDVDAMAEVARHIHRSRPDLGAGQGRPSPRGGVPGRRRQAPAEVADVLFDGRDSSCLRGPGDTANTHGTGCSLSAAIAAHLARGADVPDAVAAAKDFVHDALLGGAGWQLGRGHGPLDHLGWIDPSGPEAGPGAAPRLRT